MPRIAFLDQDASHILAVDQHARKRLAVTVRRIRVRIPPDIDAARAEQLLQPVLGEDGQAPLRNVLNQPVVRAREVGKQRGG